MARPPIILYVIKPTQKLKNKIKYLENKNHILSTQNKKITFETSLDLLLYHRFFPFKNFSHLKLNNLCPNEPPVRHK